MVDKTPSKLELKATLTNRLVVLAGVRSLNDRFELGCGRFSDNALLGTREGNGNHGAITAVFLLQLIIIITEYCRNVLVPIGEMSGL